MNYNHTELIEQHVTKHLSEPAEVFHELIPTSDVHIDIHVVEPTEQRPFYTLVTSGMSEQPMKVPRKQRKDMTPYVELMLCLPKDWKMDEVDTPQWGWPIRWMQLLGKYPHDYETLLYVGHTIPNDDPPKPFADTTQQCCWFVRLPGTVPESFMELKIDKKRTILFLGLNSIYESEMNFALSNEPQSRFALNQKLEAAGVTELINLDRNPVC